MSDNPQFKHIIDLALQRKQQDAAAKEQSQIDEELRVQLNFGKVREALDEIVLPVFRAAARELTEAGCYASVQDTRDTSNETKRLTLLASLHAGAMTAQPPQTYATLSYEGNAVSLAFTCRASGATLSLPITAITQEAVTAQVAKFLGNCL